MTVIVKINDIALGDIAALNERMTFTKFNEIDTVTYSVSLNPASLDIPDGLSDSTVVTSSHNWTAAKTSDADNIISSFTGSGGNGDSLTVQMNLKGAGSWATAVIRVTVGSTFADLPVDIIV